MFYQFDDEVLSVKVQELNDNLLCAGFVSPSELENIYKIFDISLQAVEKCKRTSNLFIGNTEVYDNFIFTKITVVNPRNPAKENCAGLFILRNAFIVVDIKDEDKSNRDAFMAMLSRCSGQDITIEKIVCAFLESLISRDSKALEEAEIEINGLEETVLENRADRNFNLRLLAMKRELLALRSYYEQLINISEGLIENENELFFDGELKSVKIFSDKAGRLKDNVDMLRNSVVHLWDSYQAYLDMRLNQTMKIFTMMTTIFFPLTLIAGWYGMNFKYMPELDWRYGYLYVFILSALVVISLFIWFKKKKWI